MADHKFKRGDRVRLVERGGINNRHLMLGSVGTVYAESGELNPHTYVEWDGFSAGHSGNHPDGFKDNRKTCWIVRSSNVELLQDEPPEAGEPAAAPSADGSSTSIPLRELLPKQLLQYAKLEGVRADQTLYVPVTGAELHRLRHAIENPKRPATAAAVAPAAKPAAERKAKKAKRAKVGDKVRVIRLQNANGYAIGSIGTVTSVADTGGAHVIWDSPFFNDERDVHRCLYLCRAEYEVIK